MPSTILKHNKTAKKQRGSNTKSNKKKSVKKYQKGKEMVINSNGKPLKLLKIKTKKNKKSYFYPNKKHIGINKVKNKINIIKGGNLEDECPVFNLDLILEVIKASNTLIENTDEDAILIFIGQSPDYLSYIVKKHRTVISVPISGRPYGDKYSIPKKENLDKYCELLTTLGITKELFDNNKIIFVDHTHSGQSPSLFTKVILRCLKYIDKYSENLTLSNRNFNFINIIDNKQNIIDNKKKKIYINDPDKKYINTIGYLIMPNLIAFANEGKPIDSEYKIPRTVPNYPHFKWHTSLDNSKLIEGRQCSLKLLLYYNFFNYFKEKKELNNENESSLNNEIKSSLLYFKDLLKKVVNKPQHIKLLNKLNNSSLKKDIFNNIDIILQQIDKINVYFEGKP